MDTRMENIDWLIDVVNNNAIKGIGGSNIVVNYENVLLKVDYELYHLAKSKDNKDVSDYLKSVYFNIFFRVRERQINYLISKQQNIKLTQLPKSILYIDHKPCGVFLYNHKDYTKLGNYKLKNIEEALLVSYNIIVRVQELLINGIYLLDLHQNNVLIKNDHIELIDLEGTFVKIGNSTKSELKAFYRCWKLILSLFNDLLNENDYQELVNFCNNTNEINSLKKLDKIKEKVKKYASIQL